MFEGEFHKCVTSVNAQLLAEVVAMAVHCPDANAEFLRNLFTGLVVGDQREHPKFSHRKTFQT